MPTREDVIWCYSTFLLREPDSDEVVESWRQRCRNFRELAQAFRESPEYQNMLARPSFNGQEPGELASLRERLAALEDVARQLDETRAALDRAHRRLDELEEAGRRRDSARSASLYVPNPPFSYTPPGRFMAFSTCHADDFLYPRFQEICAALNYSPRFHRKLWEWVFITHHLLQSGEVKPGARGLVFGVGSERLPALFAKMGASIVATDAPMEIGEASGWTATGQHSASLSQLRYTDIVDGDTFDRNVSYEPCDMNDISAHLQGFDFNWSSCCFEHLGNLEAGMQFVVNAVEKTLRVGGIAVHTTEFNLSSNDDTIESGPTVIYRRRDIEELVRRLESRGHHVEPLIVGPDTHPLDFHVDVPPYTHVPHIKLMLAEYVATSVGLVIRRGR